MNTENVYLHQGLSPFWNFEESNYVHMMFALKVLTQLLFWDSSLFSTSKIHIQSHHISLTPQFKKSFYILSQIFLLTSVTLEGSKEKYLAGLFKVPALSHGFHSHRETSANVNPLLPEWSFAVWNALLPHTVSLDPPLNAMLPRVFPVQFSFKHQWRWTESGLEIQAVYCLNILEK